MAQSVRAKRDPKPLAILENFSPELYQILLQLKAFTSRAAGMRTQTHIYKQRTSGGALQIEIMPIFIFDPQLIKIGFAFNTH